MAVRQRMPSATAAWRMAAASRTGPGSGDGVLTTSPTEPPSISSRMPGRPSEAASPRRATSRTAWPRPRSASAVPAVAARR